MKKEEFKGIQVSELTPFEKFCRLPKCIWRLQGNGRTKKLPFRLSLEYTEDNASLDNCTIEYITYPEFGDEEYANDCHWNGTFEEVVEKAYQYFHNTAELLEDESKQLVNNNICQLVG